MCPTVARSNTGHAWTGRNSVALEPLIPNRIGTFGPDRNDPSHVKCNWRIRGDPEGGGQEHWTRWLISRADCRGFFGAVDRKAQVRSKGKQLEV